MRRSRRLLPALLFMLAFYLAADAAKGQDGLAAVATAGLYSGNIVQAAGHFVPVELRHLWSLAEEEQFYVLWPLLLLLLMRAKRPARWVVGITVALIAYRLGIVASGVRTQRLYMSPDLHAEGLMLGALLASTA
jgi:peptidoglycan/LPS O-acetylase OafA/YrhL